VLLAAVIVRRSQNAAIDAWKSLEDYRKVLYARYRAGRDISAHEAAELRRRWEVVQR
jgi:hypothetical protein